MNDYHELIRNVVTYKNGPERKWVVDSDSLSAFRGNRMYITSACGTLSANMDKNLLQWRCRDVISVRLSVCPYRGRFVCVCPYINYCDKHAKLSINMIEQYKYGVFRVYLYIREHSPDIARYIMINFNHIIKYLPVEYF